MKDSSNPKGVVDFRAAKPDIETGASRRIRKRRATDHVRDPFRLLRTPLSFLCIEVEDEQTRVAAIVVNKKCAVYVMSDEDLS